MGDRKALLEQYKPWGLAWKLISPPTTGTSACKRFFETWAKTNNLLAFILRMSVHITEASKAAKEYFQKYGEEEIFKDLESVSIPVDILKKHLQLLFELLVCRHVDNYLTYLSNLLSEAFRLRPELLRSNAKVEVDMILQHKSLDDLISVLAERKIQKLAYEPFTQVVRFFKSRLDLEIAGEEDLSRLTEAIEIRNISVHNACVINRRYMQRLRLDSSLIGTMKRLNIENVEPLAIVIGDP